jgi:hypothetical protein
MMIENCTLHICRPLDETEIEELAAHFVGLDREAIKQWLRSLNPPLSPEPKE